ncbi:MAG: Calx-beta domain-containing protein, partial [Planctomycetota bacterium]
STPISVTLSGVSGDAISGIDFPLINRRITIPAGTTQLSVSIPTRYDLLDEPDESFSVSLLMPVGATMADHMAKISITDDDPPALRIADCVVSETQPEFNSEGNSINSTGSYQSLITMSSTSPVPVTVRVTSRDRTAVSGRDYTRILTTIIIPAGQTEAVVNLTITDDNVFEPSERFELVLSATVNATIERGVASVSIGDNDPEPVLTIADTLIVEGNTGELLVTVRVNMSRPSALPVTFQYQTLDGTAIAGRDYLAAAGTRTIYAGATLQTFTIRLRNDRIDEDAETLRVVLPSVINGSAVPNGATITIEDNDPPPELAISNATIVEGDSTNVTSSLLLRLSTASERSISVDFQTANHTAKAGIDYQTASGTVIFLPGQISANLNLTSVADLNDEPSRAFRVILSSPVATVLTNTTAVVTVLDDDGPLLPLFEMSDMQYLGGFQVPTGDQGSASFAFGGNGLAFNPQNNSLFIGSNVNDGLNLAEISIPDQLSSTGIISSMATASILQPFVNPGNLISFNSDGSATPPVFNYENLNLGGLLVANGGLTGAMFNGYTGAEPSNSTNSHFRTNTLNLASLTSTNSAGLLDIRANSNGLSGRVRGGYMAEVPQQWRDYIGANYVTGAAGQNRIEHSSAGPALFGFDAESPAASSDDPLVYYPISQPLQWSDRYVVQPLFNGTTRMTGVAFVPGTRSVIFVGSNGLSEIGYGVGSAFNDRSRPDSGFHSRNGNYKYQIWAYDIEDFMAVRNGSRASWEIKPTRVVNFDLPTPEASKHIGGTAFDPATGRLYVVQQFAGSDSTPIIHVYQLGR